MLLKETIQKSQDFFHKTFRNLKSLFFGGYQKLPKSLSFKAFSCGGGKLQSCKTDQFYADFYDELESHLDKVNKTDTKVVVAAEEVMTEGNAGPESFVKLAKAKHEGSLKEKKTGISHLGKGRESNSQKTDAGGYVLAQKMKELEMIDAGDMEQALDVEEAIHYYSRLKSPVYLDIVDKFFTDMYSEISIPQPSTKINNSKRRLGSFRL
ncbi:hypothetical protein UlMin_018128 [Ulmus minor]